MFEGRESREVQQWQRGEDGVMVNVEIAETSSDEMRNLKFG